MFPRLHRLVFLRFTDVMHTANEFQQYLARYISHIFLILSIIVFYTDSTATVELKYILCLRKSSFICNEEGAY